MYTLENVCYNIRNVKSNYLKCIASRCLSPPKFVYYFSYQTSMAEEQKSQCDSPMLMHDLTQKGNHVLRISFHHRGGGRRKHSGNEFGISQKNIPTSGG